MPLTIARADASAIPFVMATERTENFDQFVGRWDEAQHRAAFADGRYVYFLGRDGSKPVGFVIERDWAAPERVTLIKRIAVSRPGQGHGRALLTQVVDVIFKETSAWRGCSAYSPRTCARAALTRWWGSRRKASPAATPSSAARPT